MSRHQMNMVIEVDDELLAAHVENDHGRNPPYSTDVSEWDAADIFAAANEGIVDPRECFLDGDYHAQQALAGQTPDDPDGVAAERGQRPHFDNEGNEVV